MAGYTKNFNLKLPSDIEFYDIEDFNENFEKIDQMAVKKGEGIGELTGGALSDRPEPGIAGRYYFAQDTGEIFLDTGEEWVLAAASQKELAAHKADYEQHTSYAIATGTNSYAVNIDGVTSLVEGMSIKVKFQNANTGTATLNINGLGAIPIKKSNGNDLSAGNIKAGQILHLVYTGSVFQLLGEGGEYGNVTPDDVIKGVTFGTEEGLKTGTLELTGNAAAADVLSGKTFYSTNPKSKLTGSMPNRGAVTHTITTQGGSYTIPAGYHNGSGKVTASFPNLVPGNIKSGVNIGGVIGTLNALQYAVVSKSFSVQVSSGSVSYSDYFTISGLSFTPRQIFGSVKGNVGAVELGGTIAFGEYQNMSVYESSHYVTVSFDNISFSNGQVTGRVAVSNYLSASGIFSGVIHFILA